MSVPATIHVPGFKVLVNEGGEIRIYDPEGYYLTVPPKTDSEASLEEDAVGKARALERERWQTFFREGCRNFVGKLAANLGEPS